MSIIALVLLLSLSSMTAATAQQQLRYNPYTGQYQYAPQGATPQYNPYTGATRASRTQRNAPIQPLYKAA